MPKESQYSQLLNDNLMAYEIFLSESGEHLIIRVTGKLTIELAAQLLSEAVRRGDNSGIARFLYDVRQSVNVESDLLNYVFAFEDLDKFLPDKAGRAAILRQPDDISHDFLVLAARKVGYNVRVFTDWDEAVAWLAE